MINFKNCIYVNQNIGTDDNKGELHSPIKSFTKAKEIISENGVVYIIGEYKTSKIEFVSNKKINVFGYSSDSKIIYFSQFGDHVNILDNIDFYKIDIVIGDSRYNCEPEMYGNYYNCIVNINGSMSDNYSNFYNCVFIKSNTGCNYRSDSEAYRVHGIYENCVFSKKYFNSDSAFKNIYTNKTNIFLDDIKDIKDTAITGRGIYFGKFPYRFNMYFVLFNNRIYKVTNDSLVNSELNDEKNDNDIINIDKNIIDFINTNYNIIKKCIKYN